MRTTAGARAQAVGILPPAPLRRGTEQEEGGVERTMNLPPAALTGRGASRAPRRGHWATLLVGIVVSALALLGRPAPSPAQGSAETGKPIYERRCSHCHGPEGKGDGPSAERLRPRPRDFTQGWFKFRSTPSGSLPSDADLLRTISEGIPGTSMPGWNDLLSEKQRRDVVAYLKTFSSRFKAEKIPPPVAFKPEIAVSQESVERGKKLFLDIECWKCHGNAGRANGPSAPTLKDEWGQPIAPANLAKPWLFRGGATRRDIYRAIMTGLTGSPMPSFADTFNLPEEELKAMEKDGVFLNPWHLVNYVDSLRRQRPTGVLLLVKRLEGELPTRYDDPAWEQAPLLEFALVGQVIEKPRWFTPAVDSVFIKGLYNDRDIALRLDWDDPTNSKKDTPEDAGGTGLVDRFALQFPAKNPEGGQRPYFLGGAPQAPVSLWAYASDPAAIKEKNASGLTEEKEQPEASQALSGQVEYVEGQYRMVVKRALTTSDKENDVQFEPGKFLPIAFSAWDGGNHEEGAKRSLSAWYLMFLQPPESAARVSYPLLAIVLTLLVEMYIVRAVRRKARRERAMARRRRA